MQKSMTASLLFLAISSALSLHDVVSDGAKEVENWFDTLAREKPPEKMTKLHFYFHDISRGKNVTVAVVAQSSIPTFGIFVAADDPLTVGPEFGSKRVGYLKGLYGTTSFEGLDVIMAMTFVFTDGIYNGSSLSVLGHNPHRNSYREVPVVGGSGQFRLARGVVSLRNYYYNLSAGNVTVMTDIVVYHY